MNEQVQWNKTWLIAKREILSQLRSKSFVISTAILLIVVFASSIFGGIQAQKAEESASEPTLVAVTSETETWAASIPGMTVVPVEDEAEATEAIESGLAEMALLPSSDLETDPLGIYLLTKDEPDSSVVMSLTLSPRVEFLANESAEDEFDPIFFIVSILFGAVFMMSAMTFGSTIAQNTVVEKQTRTVEILVSAVPAAALLGGKILGNSALAIAQTTAILAVGVAGLALTGQGSLLSMVSPVAVWFIVFFIFGFVLVASIFAASASLVSRIEDTGSVLAPIMMLVALPYFVVVMFGQNASIMAIASYFPFSSTVTMPLRLMSGTVPVWEPLLSLAILILCVVLAIFGASRIYSQSLLKTGPRIKIKDAWKTDV